MVPISGPAFMHVDVFNGDADGLCALHQWRMAFPVASQLITGVKRDIHLLARVQAQAGDVVTVFDIALKDNAQDALRLLGAGATLEYFDHHEAVDLPAAPQVKLHLNASAEMCTSLLVDREVGGAYRPWAIVAAFGDNLDRVARRLCEDRGIPMQEQEALAELGRLLNYNSYGDTLADLNFAPEQLYAAIRAHVDPVACWREVPEIGVLREAFARDWALVSALVPMRDTASGIAIRLPPAPWARRIHGTLANRLADSAPGRAVAVLVENGDGTMRISVRAPQTRPQGADRLCRGFITGGGRASAAGISRLPRSEVETFLVKFDQAFAAQSS